MQQMEVDEGASAGGEGGLDADDQQSASVQLEDRN